MPVGLGLGMNAAWPNLTSTSSSPASATDTLTGTGLEEDFGGAEDDDDDDDEDYFEGDDDAAESGGEAPQKYMLMYQQGRWTKKEHDSFVKALRDKCRSWVEVSQRIRTRSPEQVRSHAQKYFVRFPSERVRRRRPAAPKFKSSPLVTAPATLAPQAQAQAQAQEHELDDAATTTTTTTSTTTTTTVMSA